MTISSMAICRSMAIADVPSFWQFIDVFSISGFKNSHSCSAMFMWKPHVRSQSQLLLLWVLNSLMMNIRKTHSYLNLLKSYLNTYFSRFKKEFLSRVLLIQVMDLHVRYRSPTEIYWKLLNNCYQYLSDSLVKPDIEFKKNKWVQ